MPVADNIPYNVTLTANDIHASIGAVVDGDSNPATNTRIIYGPLFNVTFDGSGGLTIYAATGAVLARFRSNGDIELRGIVIVDENTPYTAPSIGMVFKNASGEIVCYVDGSGNLIVPVPIAHVDSIDADYTGASGVNTPDVGKYTILPIDTCPVVALVVPDTLSVMPIIQLGVLDALGNLICGIAMSQDGSILNTGIVQFGIEDNGADVYWSF